MDNAIHKTTPKKELIERKGHHYVYLPPYSPFLNPIENLFNQWKGLIKRKEARNEDELYEYVHSASADITEQHCANYFANMENYIIHRLDGIRIEN